MHVCSSTLFELAARRMRRYRSSLLFVDCFFERITSLKPFLSSNDCATDREVVLLFSLGYNRDEEVHISVFCCGTKADAEDANHDRCSAASAARCICTRELFGGEPFRIAMSSVYDYLLFTGNR
mmetsp:Transcript_15675/g.23172  ORF Transcript_15675/g.23172 Transcript_15675/m.23172 type:complete len:124 (-) Transcript_15675:85-456(-)